MARDWPTPMANDGCKPSAGNRKTADLTHAAGMWMTPTARDIQRMEDCIGWLAWLDPEDARIVWLRAERVRWRQVCIRAGVVRSTAWRRWAASLLTIAKHLNTMEKSGRKPNAPKRVADRNVVKPDETGSGTLL